MIGKEMSRHLFGLPHAASEVFIISYQGSHASLKSLRMSLIFFGQFKALKSLKNGASSVTGFKMSNLPKVHEFFRINVKYVLP